VIAGSKKSPIAGTSGKKGDSQVPNPNKLRPNSRRRKFSRFSGVQIAMHPAQIDHEGRAINQHVSADQTSNRQFAGRKRLLKGVDGGFNIGPNSIIGTGHALAQTGHLDGTLLDMQGGWLMKVGFYPTLILKERTSGTGLGVKNEPTTSRVYAPVARSLVVPPDRSRLEVDRPDPAATDICPSQNDQEHLVSPAEWLDAG